VPGAHAYLTGNGFAPVVTVRDATGEIAFSGPVAFLPQDGNMTSLGVIKVPDARPSQLGIIAFFYPTAGLLDSGAYTSIYPDPVNPLLTLNLYRGDLGLDEGVPSNVYALDTSNLEQVAGRDAPNPPIELAPGESAVLPEGLGSVSFDGLLRFASLDIAHNPGGSWVLAFALVALFAMLLMLLVPRQRVWVRVKPAELARIEVAGLAPRDQSRIQKLVDALAEDLQRKTQPND
jgi:cytochrome c biogenesis protein